MLFPTIIVYKHIRVIKIILKLEKKLISWSILCFHKNCRRWKLICSILRVLKLYSYFIKIKIKLLSTRLMDNFRNFPAQISNSGLQSNGDDYSLSGSLHVDLPVHDWFTCPFIWCIVPLIYDIPPIFNQIGKIYIELPTSP